MNFPNMCSNIPASPAYGVYISQLIRYARASSNYSDFLKRQLYLKDHPSYWGYSCSAICFMCSVLSSIICLVYFLFAFPLSVLRFTSCDYLLGKQCRYYMQMCERSERKYTQRKYTVTPVLKNTCI
jgi:hypothetical protein